MGDSDSRRRKRKGETPTSNFDFCNENLVFFGILFFNYFSIIFSFNFSHRRTLLHQSPNFLQSLFLFLRCDAISSLGSLLNSSPHIQELIHSLSSWTRSGRSKPHKSNPGFLFTIELEDLTMDDQGGSKLTGIRQIVRLKEMLQRWQTVTLGSRSNTPISEENHGGVSRSINKMLTDVMCCDDSDGESCQSLEPPPDVPKGYLAVYVGPELRRFIIPTTYLSHPVFKILLEKAEEEFGYDHNGGLTLPCEIETFKYLLKCIEHHPRSHPVESSVPEQLEIH